MFCSCFGSGSNADYEAQHVHHKFFEVGLAHDINSKHRETMEDAHTVKVPFMGDESGFFAIFDGHGGKQVSEQVSKTLHTLLEAEIRKKGESATPTMKECFEVAYAAMDEQVKDFPGDPGSTAITCLIRREGAGMRLYAANAGDARGVLCRNGRAVRVSYDHKPTDEREKQRITDLGGFVANGRVNGILAVSRSLGDHPFKRWVVSTPHFLEADISLNDSMLLLGCDGVWDVMEDQAALDLVRGEPTAQRVCDKLLREALRLGSRDNVSVLAVRFRWEGLRAAV